MDWKKMIDWEPGNCWKPSFLDFRCSPSMLSTFERDNDADFPKDYKEFMLCSNGGKPPRSRLTICGFPGRVFELKVYGLGARPDMNPEITNVAREWLPASLVQIGLLCDAANDLETNTPAFVAMPTRKDRAIYGINLLELDLDSIDRNYASWPNGIYRLADTFSGLLRKLE